MNGRSSGFASVFGGGFGSAFSGPRLTSFAKPGEAFKSDKPARPFGAPESDVDERSGDGEDEGGECSGDDDDAEKEEKETEEPKASQEDKKKPKLQKGKQDRGCLRFP
jgi:hypothetical protein